ncbi:MAG: hypothetical protein HY262_09530 [Chloroflexi bacterium]|nr:hypothetical protein [Chloroflexota bacterium]
MNFTVDALIDLRSRILDNYIVGRTSQEAFRLDLAAIAVEIDRLLSPAGQAPLEERAARVLTEILADSRARCAAVTPAKAARLEFWHRRRLERLRRDDPQGYEAALQEEDSLAVAEADEVRMVRPILAALGDTSLALRATERVRAIADQSPIEADQPQGHVPDAAWTDDDRLLWEEFAGGVPCQGCGRPFLGDETRQRDAEPWPSYRKRLEPIEAEFRSQHPDHGTSWTVGGGPAHCRRCCAPHPLSAGQIEQINHILSKPAQAAVNEVARKRCGTCHMPVEGDHVCQLADLPKRLRAVVEAVIERERGREPTSRTKDQASGDIARRSRSVRSP